MYTIDEYKNKIIQADNFKGKWDSLVLSENNLNTQINKFVNGDQNSVLVVDKLTADNINSLYSCLVYDLKV